jgi:hypothetical protein
VRTHVGLTDREIVELRALCEEAADGLAGERLEQLRSYASHLVLDVLALRLELRAHFERARLDHERLVDVLERARPHVERAAFGEELHALLAEIDDLLARRF